MEDVAEEVKDMEEGSIADSESGEEDLSEVEKQD